MIGLDQVPCVQELIRNGLQVTSGTGVTSL